MGLPGARIAHETSIVTPGRGNLRHRTNRIRHSSKREKREICSPWCGRPARKSVAVDADEPSAHKPELQNVEDLTDGAIPDYSFVLLRLSASTWVRFLISVYWRKAKATASGRLRIRFSPRSTLRLPPIPVRF